MPDEIEKIAAKKDGAKSAPSLAQEIEALTGIDPARCYQCGKCTAGCPMAEEMTLGPQQMIRLMQLDRRARLLGDESMWLCLTCETCTTRCPNEVDPARLIDGAREIALRNDRTAAPRRIRAFHQAFLDQIRRHGRIFELELVSFYKLRSGALFDDVTAAPGMFARGKLALVPRTIADVESVRRIFDACAEEKEKT